MRKVGAVVLTAAVLGFALGASSNASSRARFVRLPGRGARPAFVPASDAHAPAVVATVRLGDAPLVVRHKSTTATVGGSAPLDDAAVRRSLLDAQAAVTSAVSRLGGDVLFQLTEVANAVVVRIPQAQLALLDALPGVVSVSQSRQLERDNTVVNAYTGASVQAAPGIRRRCRVGPWPCSISPCSGHCASIR
jgi:hypothetical protein